MVRFMMGRIVLNVFIAPRLVLIPRIYDHGILSSSQGYGMQLLNPSILCQKLKILRNSTIQKSIIQKNIIKIYLNFTYQTVICPTALDFGLVTNCPVLICILEISSFAALSLSLHTNDCFLCCVIFLVTFSQQNLSTIFLSNFQNNIFEKTSFCYLFLFVSVFCSK